MEFCERDKSKSLEHGYKNGITRDKLKDLTGYTREVYERRYHPMNDLCLVCNLKLVHGGGKRYSEEELWDILKKPKYIKIP
ncbi:hypothetical protein ACFX5U_05355 [Sphingobacterium sp. SG20118]|uniref:hypothetical protein n=1 Tax=Sphingobacterium TaxID=28453 RepID=UPI002469B840|nr:hypothetical protein [Sphingobacterium faecium]MDH5827441.1 hypothetical protein [Sphingobacterium faecium]